MENSMFSQQYIYLHLVLCFADKHKKNLEPFYVLADFPYLNWNCVVNGGYKVKVTARKQRSCLCRWILES